MATPDRSVKRTEARKDATLAFPTRESWLTLMDRRRPTDAPEVWMPVWAPAMREAASTLAATSTRQIMTLEASATRAVADMMAARLT
jgi:hypothetical protein